MDDAARRRLHRSPARLPGRTVEVRRPDVYFDPRTQPDFVRLNYTPPPELVALFGGDYHRLCFHPRAVHLLCSEPT